MIRVKSDTPQSVGFLWMSDRPVAETSNWQHIIINIIIIWHYKHLWVFAFSAKSLQVLPSLDISFQFLAFSSFRSSITYSYHRCLGLPSGLGPISFQSSSFLAGLVWPTLWICPNHLILCALMNLTTSAPSINLSISVLFPILHILSILTGPYIFLNIYLFQKCVGCFNL